MAFFVLDWDGWSSHHTGEESSPTRPTTDPHYLALAHGLPRLAPLVEAGPAGLLEREEVDVGRPRPAALALARGRRHEDVLGGLGDGRGVGVRGEVPGLHFLEEAPLVDLSSDVTSKLTLNDGGV